ncbi:MAG: CPBP family intramembrane metalloprotease [Hyphomonadaceae bacterium]|nr:CPBP family intramembrane metalloprotease [Hyphomonadaceae bacterium]
MALGQAGWLAPGRLRWARALAWLCVLAVLCILAFNLAADASLRLSAMVSGEVFTSRANAPPVARLIAVIIGSIAMLGAYAIAVSIVERRKIPELGLGRLLPDIFIGLAIGGLLIVTIIGLMRGAGWVTIVATPVTQIAESLKQSVQSGVIEEVLMRIIIFRLLWRAAGVFPSLILTALLFGGLHLSNPDATVFSALCLLAGEGIGAGLYLLTGRVWMSIGMHAGWNFAQGWLFGSAVSGLDVFAGGPLHTRPVDGVATTLSGGGFGPESSLAALIVSLLASLIFLSIAWKKGRFITPADSDRSA